MSYRYVCRWCKGPPLEAPPIGACPNCRGFYRHDRVHIIDRKEGEREEPEDGVVMSASALMSGPDDESEGKRPTGWGGVDWVFDGGLPYFGTVLLCAMPGTGKSTFLWELLMALSAQKVGTLYISSEQSLKDLRRQFKRCGTPPRRMSVDSESNYDKIVSKIERVKPEIAVLDSIHDVDNMSVVDIAKEFTDLCEDMMLLAFLVGHMNNDGTMRGGSDLRHEVGATLALDRNDDDRDPRRYLQFRGKTRFGMLGRRALFEMRDTGFKDCGPLVDEPRPEKPEKAEAPVVLFPKPRLPN